MNYFASNIKFLRIKTGLDQGELCANIGFKQSTWSGYENGKSNPTAYYLKELADSLEIKVSDFFNF